MTSISLSIPYLRAAIRISLDVYLDLTYLAPPSHGRSRYTSITALNDTLGVCVGLEMATLKSGDMWAAS
jgi:hypothetical protein